MVLEAVVLARQRRLRPGESQPHAQAATEQGQRLPGLRVLLTEDNLNNQQVARELLEAEGATVCIANNGQECVAAVALAVPPFDVVLMDLQMPVMDGLTATRHIRQTHDAHRLPIVAMTANALSDDRLTCLEAGMNDHVGKPFDIEQLVALLCRLARRPAPVATATPPLAAAQAVSAAVGVASLELAGQAGIDMVAALQRMGGKVPIYARALCGALPSLVDTAQALRPRSPMFDAAEAAQRLHSIKGLAATLGMTALADAASTAERAVRADTAAVDIAAACAVVEAVWAAHAPAVAELSAALEPALEPAWVPEATVGSPPPPELSGEAARSLHQGLESLAAFLQHSDMRATELVRALRAQGVARFGLPWQQLESAVDALDFEVAVPLCRQLLASLPATVAGD